MVEDIVAVHDLRVTIDPPPDDDMIRRTELKTKANPNDAFYIVPNIRPDHSVVVRRSSEIPTPTPRERSRSRGGSGRHFGANAGTIAGANDGGNSEGGLGFVGYPFILTFQSTSLNIVDYHFLCDTL